MLRYIVGTVYNLFLRFTSLTIHGHIRGHRFLQEYTSPSKSNNLLHSQPVLFFWPRGPVLFHRNPKRCALRPLRVADTRGATSFLRSFGNSAELAVIVDFGSDMYSTGTIVTMIRAYLAPKKTCFEETRPPVPYVWKPTSAFRFVRERGIEPPRSTSFSEQDPPKSLFCTY